jgi:exosortase A
MRHLFGRSVALLPPGMLRVRRARVRAPSGSEVAPVAQGESRSSVVLPGAIESAGVAKSQVATDVGGASLRSAGRYMPVLATALAALGILSLYWQTAASIVAIWIRSETFAHGFVVIPICFWLVWRDRESLAQLDARPWWPALIGVLLAGALWLVASAADTLGVKQFALAFMIQAAIVAVVGPRVARALLFPLAFLLFAVPAGEIFIPTLIDRTADFTVAALRWSGVPVYREANHFLIPSGAWSVVEACSGIRYIVASLMVGTIYAAVAYRSPRRRIMFIGASIIVPIIANWLRAYMIVMLAHLTNNRLAVGVDHLIYGWLFFGVVMLLLFWVGSFWQQESTARPSIAAPLADQVGVRSSNSRGLFVTAIIAIAVAAIWLPIEAGVARSTSAEIPVLRAMNGGNGWTPSSAAIANWKPHYSGFSAELSQTFQKEDRVVGLYLAYFRNQEKKHELVTSGNVLVTKVDWRWKEVATGSDSVDWAGARTPVHRAEISGPDIHLDIYRLYWVNGTVTASDYVAKAVTAWSKLRGQGDDSALILMYAPQAASGKSMDAVLRDFAAALSPSIENTLDSAHAGSK